jgi:putative CocE/NonD family hydrolase
LLFVALAFAASAHPAPLQDDKQPKAGPAEVLPTKVSGISDAGTFLVVKDEEILARINFTWKEDGTYESRATVELPGKKLELKTTITPDKAGYWTKIEGVAPAGNYLLERDGDKVKRTIAKKTATFTLKPGAILFEDFGPALVSLAVRAYDSAKGGKQTLPTVLLPGALLDATLERKDTVERSVAGKDLKLTRYSMSIGAAEILIWADADFKVYLAEVTNQQAAFVREGYESLRKVEVADPLLSQPKFKVKVEPNVRVAMRDGVKLGTDIYRPDAEGKYPVILMRTPYKKEIFAAKAKYYARRGYAVAVQDCRGRFSSEGVWVPFIHEAKDGFDAVEWLPTQPWCESKVGMIGASYGGWVQWWAATERPPHLVTIIPNVAPPDPFYNIPYDHGVLFLAAGFWWMRVVEEEATTDPTGQKMKDLTGQLFDKRLSHLPVIDLDKVIMGKEVPYWRHWIEHNSNDAYWQPANYLDRLDKVTIPVFLQSGWFDSDGIGSKLAYARLAAAGHTRQKLTLGPWGHADSASRTLSKHDFGQEALRDLARDYLRWFDHWLKGVDNGVDKEPLVSLFVMNANKWIYGSKYPLQQTRFEKWYLSGGGKANTSQGDGKLTREPPGKDAQADHYRYDPGDPTPDPDLAPLLQQGDKKDDKDKKETGKDLREELTRTRSDILVYVSEPFAEPYTFVGPVSAVLYAASSAKDTDWFVRLMTVDDRGEVFVLGEGKIRARFRQSMAKPALLESGKVYEYALDLWQTGIMVPKGHRLRVEVASASFPSFSRNLNTGGHNEKDTQFVAAEQTVYHNAQYPSHVVLPVIPEVAPKK